MRFVHIAALIAVSLPIVGMISTAEARTHHHHYKHHRSVSFHQHTAKAYKTASLCVSDNNGRTSCQGAVETSQEGFSGRLHRHASRRGGACDGFQRCRCGTTAARLHGLPYSYKGFNLKLASEWGRAFPHTSFHVGAVGVKPHHVLTVIGGSNCSSATVQDDAGTYQRNVCNMTFVSVSSGMAMN